MAVVVGGAGAIGGAIMRQLRESGAHTITLDVDVQGSDAIACDVRDAASMANAFARLERLDMVSTPLASRASRSSGNSASMIGMPSMP